MNTIDAAKEIEDFDTREYPCYFCSVLPVYETLNNGIGLSVECPECHTRVVSTEDSISAIEGWERLNSKYFEKSIRAIKKSDLIREITTKNSTKIGKSC